MNKQKYWRAIRSPASTVLLLRTGGKNYYRQLRLFFKKLYRSKANIVQYTFCMQNSVSLKHSELVK